jgi:SAM-dependent methyltransferase
MSTDKRAIARALAEKAFVEGRPLAWFEELYQKARDEAATVPWADLVPNPNVIPLFQLVPNLDNRPRRGLKVACGYGDDAEWLAEHGFEVTAFDIAPTAIAECRRRFPDSKVNYIVADLFTAPVEWNGRFHVVWESYTLQVLPPALRQEAIKAISRFVAPGGYLMFAARAREEDEPEGSMPWPLTRAEALAFTACGLREVFFEDFAAWSTTPLFWNSFISLLYWCSIIMGLRKGPSLPLSQTNGPTIPTTNVGF